MVEEKRCEWADWSLGAQEAGPETKKISRGEELRCGGPGLAQSVAHSHGLETLVSERLSSCFDALENEPLNVEDVERPCAIGGFSVAARL